MSYRHRSFEEQLFPCRQSGYMFPCSYIPRTLFQASRLVSLRAAYPVTCEFLPMITPALLFPPPNFVLSVFMNVQAFLLIHGQCFLGMLKTTYPTGVHMHVFIYHPFSKYSRGCSWSKH